MRFDAYTYDTVASRVDGQIQIALLNFLHRVDLSHINQIHTFIDSKGRLAEFTHKLPDIIPNIIYIWKIKDIVVFIISLASIKYPYGWYA